MKLVLDIFDQAFKGTGISSSGSLTMRELHAASLKYKDDAKRNFALRPLLAAMDPDDGGVHDPDLHFGLAQCYQGIGLIHEATRSAILATAQYVMEGSSGITYAAQGGRILLSTGMSRDAVQQIFEGPQQAYQNAFYELPEHARRRFVTKQGSSIENTDRRKIQKTLDIINRTVAYKHAGLDFAAQLFTPEQARWTDIILKEGKLLLAKLGVPLTRSPQASDLVCVGSKDFKSIIAAEDNAGGSMGSEVANDGYTMAETSFFEKGKSLPNFIHTACHEVFGHLSATKTHEYGKQEGTVHRKQAGIKIQNKTRTGVDIRFEWLDEYITEVLGYILRLQLLLKYSDEITREMGNDGLAQVYSTFTDHGVRVGVSVLRAIAEKEKISSMDVIKMMCETYYKGKLDFYGRVRNALGDRKFQDVATLGGADPHSTIEKIRGLCGINIVASTLQNKPIFTNNDPLTEPLFRDMVAFLKS